MKFLFRRFQKIDQTEAELVENSLRTTLRAVEPRANFVADLKARLVSQALVESKQPLAFRSGLYIFAGFLGGVILIATGVRALLTILVTFGVIRHMRGQKATMAGQPVP
jgi:hypothetical protein